MIVTGCKAVDVRKLSNMKHTITGVVLLIMSIGNSAEMMTIVIGTIIDIDTAIHDSSWTLGYVGL